MTANTVSTPPARLATAYQNSRRASSVAACTTSSGSLGSTRRYSCSCSGLGKRDVLGGIQDCSGTLVSAFLGGLIRAMSTLAVMGEFRVMPVAPEGVIKLLT